MSSYNESQHFAFIVDAGDTLDAMVAEAWYRDIEPELTVVALKAQGVVVSATYVLAMYELHSAEYADHRDLVPHLTVAERGVL